MDVQFKGRANVSVMEAHGLGHRTFENVQVAIHNDRVEVRLDEPVGRWGGGTLRDGFATRRMNFPSHICTVFWLE